MTNFATYLLLALAAVLCCLFAGWLWRRVAYWYRYGSD